MVSIRQFVGAVLEQITKARVAGDAASLRVAQQYLQHDYMKGFAVPAMHIKDVELELTFAVAPGWKPANIFSQEDVRLNAVNQLEHFMQQLPAHPELKGYFARDPSLARRWNAGLPGLRERFDRTLAESQGTRPALVHSISILIENHFYASARDLRDLLALIVRPFTHRSPEAPRPVVSQYVHEGVNGILTSLDNTTTEAQSLFDSPDIDVMIGKDELDKIPESKLQKMRITLWANDRKWVASQQPNGDKVYTLSR